MEAHDHTLPSETLHPPCQGTQLRAVSGRTTDLDLDMDVAAVRAAERHDLVVDVFDIVGSQRTGKIEPTTLGGRRDRQSSPTTDPASHLRTSTH